LSLSSFWQTVHLRSWWDQTLEGFDPWPLTSFSEHIKRGQQESIQGNFVLEVMFSYCFAYYQIWLCSEFFLLLMIRLVHV
jgi:hypothetical protein